MQLERFPLRPNGTRSTLSGKSKASLHLDVDVPGQKVRVSTAYFATPAVSLGGLLTHEVNVD